MTILTRPYMQTANAHLLPIDRKDPSLVLYLPLWYPYSDMDGTTIYSYDSNRQSCTVTGAVYGIQGRTFDALDDNISAGSPAVLDNIFDGGGTAIAWINPVSDGENSNGTFVSKINTAGWALYLVSESAGSSKLAFYQYWSTTAFNPLSTNTVIPNNSWTMAAITYDNDNVANDSIFYVNGATIAQSNVNPAGSRNSDAAFNLKIGDRDTDNVCFDGTIGDVLLYNRVLSAAEILKIYTLTKWRY